MGPEHQPYRDVHLPPSSVKRADGLQNLMSIMDPVKHRYWSENGVKDDKIPTPCDISIHLPSSAPTSSSTTTHQSPPSTSERKASSLLSPCEAATSCYQAVPFAGTSSMADFSKMDTQTLIAAALAPAPNAPTPERQINHRLSSKQTQYVPQQDQADQKLVKGKSAERRRGESTASPEYSEDKDRSSAAQQTLSEDRDSLASALTGGSGKPMGRKATRRSKYRSNYNLDDTEDENYDDDDDGEDLPIMARTRQKAKKPTQSVPFDTILPKELAGLGTNPTRPKRKPKSGLSQNKRRGGREETETPVTSTPGSYQNYPKRSQRQKKIRQLLNSNPSTPSTPGSPMVNRSTDETLIDGDFDDDGNDDSDTADDLPAAKKQKKETGSATTPTKAKAKAKAKNATPGSSKRSTSAKNRTYNFPVAVSLTEASEADKMMFRWKGEGKSWKEISAEWGRITGKLPGPSSLSVRYIKLKEKFSKMGDPDFARLIEFKASLEQTFEATEKWDRIAVMIEDDGGGSYSGQTLKAKFRNMVEEEQLRSDLAGPVTFAADGGGGGEGSSSGGVGMRPQVTMDDLDNMDYELMGIERPVLGGGEVVDDDA